MLIPAKFIFRERDLSFLGLHLLTNKYNGATIYELGQVKKKLVMPDVI
jgi:hypothetical protein